VLQACVKYIAVIQAYVTSHAYLALLQAGAVHIDGWEQILEQGGCQLQMLFTTKVVHHHQGGILHIKAGYINFPLFVKFAFAVSFVFAFSQSGLDLIL